MQFFGREVSDTGCELLVKVGTRFADPENSGHVKSWRDGQIVQVRPMLYHNGASEGMCRVIIRLPNVNYTTIGGRLENNWSIHPKKLTLWDKINYCVNNDGKYEFELIEGTKHVAKRKTRDYFLDFEALKRAKTITDSEKDGIYDYDHKSIITLSNIFSLEDVLKHEDVDTRLDIQKLMRHASITSGTHSIGSGLDYSDVASFESAIGSQLTGNLTGEHNDEETTISSPVTFDTDTNSYLLKLTAQSGDEHNGGAYGNGARINYGTSDRIAYDETNDGDLDDIEISNLALDISGNANRGVYLFDGMNSGSWKVNRLLIKGDGNSAVGIDQPSATVIGGDLYIINNIVYGVGNGGQDAGVYMNPKHFGGNEPHLYVYNNSCIKNYNNFVQTNANSVATEITFKNNLAQGDIGGSDYVDDGGGYGTTAKNISEDATSPDASYQSKDLHTNSVFENYASDDYRIDKDGDSTNLAIVDDGEDLSGTFTDDIANAAGRRSDPFDIGASQRDPAAGGNAPTGALCGPLAGVLGGPV